DSSGMIWIARRSGVSSFDGMDFVNYNVSDGLKATTYAFLQVDERGNLWAFPEAGDIVVSRWNGNRWITTHYNKDLHLPFGSIFTAFNQYYEGTDTLFVAGTQKDGFYICGKQGQWKRFTTEEGLPSNIINCLARMGGETFIGTEKGLSILRNGVIRSNPVYDSPIPPGPIRAMTADGGRIWMIGSNWLGYLEGKSFHAVASDFLLPESPTLNRCFLTPDRAGNIYFGNPYVVLFHTPQTLATESIGRDNGLISPGGTSVLVDREGNVWVAGYRGITKIGSKRFISYFQNDGIFSNEVASGIELAPGHYVFGHDCALTYLDGSSFSHLVLDRVHARGRFETRVLDLDKDKSGNLWIAGSALGIARVDPERKITWFNKKNSLKGVTYAVAVGSGGEIFAGTTEGLFRLENEQFIPVLPNYYQKMGVRKIFPGPGNEINLATLGYGLVRINNQKIDTFPVENSPGAKNVYCYYPDNKGEVWIGTSAGLFVIRGRELKRVEIAGLKTSRPVYTITGDRQGNLWFGTDNGIFRWNGTKMEHFTTADGLSGLEINRDAVFADKTGRVWIGTNNGLTVFRPLFDYKSDAVPPPVVRVVSIDAGNQKFLPGEEIRLPSRKNDLVVHLMIISFIDEKKITYRYRLENLNKNWTEALPYKENKLRLSNLPPGSYRLQIQASNALGIWSKPVTSSLIIIDQPLWFKWWFIGSLVLFLCLVVALTGRFILVSRYNARLEKMVALRTAELRESNAAKDRFFSIIAHDLKNPFHFILGILDLLTSKDSKYPEKEMAEMLQKLKKTSRSTMDLLENLLTWARSQKGLLPFNPEKCSVDGLIDETLFFMEPLAREKNIGLRREGEKELSVFADREMVHTILRNLVSNAIKFTPSGGSVTAGFSRKNQDGVVISITDTGIGIPAAMQEKLFKIDERVSTRGTRNETGTGLGLILCREFAVKNNGTISVISEPERGSTFLLTLPAFGSQVG
ncbi:MAG: ATP-binding protein, partial [bacterium]